MQTMTLHNEAQSSLGIARYHLSGSRLELTGLRETAAPPKCGSAFYEWEGFSLSAMRINSTTDPAFILRIA
jgi:hypothetical protein